MTTALTSSYIKLTALIVAAPLAVMVGTSRIS